MATHRTATLTPVVTVFISSACIMVIELVAGRLVSRHIGQSLYTWTTIIGVVLAGISLGNYLGGRLADTSSGRRTLAVQFVAAALGCIAVMPLNAAAGAWLPALGLSWPVRILCHITIVFMLPSILLGTISPVIAKRALALGQSTGRTMGNVYAFAIAGSIAGTFITGFYLIAVMTTTTIIGVAAGTLAALGLVYALGHAVFSKDLAVTAPSTRSQKHAAPPAGFRDLLAPIIVVFMANACLMAAEIVAGRIISRHYGQSIYAWTAVIGIILAGMTAGSWLGGRWADRFAASKTLTVLFLTSALACLCVPFMSDALINSQVAVTYSWPVQITLHVVLTFALPSILLGAVGPVAASMALARGHAAGRTVGDIYAWGSVGSIVGTFLAGFYLVAAVGMNATLYIVAAALIVMGASSAWRMPRMRIGASTCLIVPIALVSYHALSPSETDVIYKAESQYSHILIVQDARDKNVRQMLLDRLIHSRVNMNDPLDIRYDYERTYTSVLDKYYPAGKPINALLIGGGGYIYPRYLEVTRPGSYLEVAEIDPEVTEAAYEAFGLPRTTTVKTYNMDARNRVDDLIRKKKAGQPVPVFDCVFGDSFNDCSVPYHLTTAEFNQDLRALLAPDGIYMMNLIDILDSGQFLAAAINACRTAWPNVYVFTSSLDPNDRNTFVLVCSARQLSLDGIPAELRRKYPYSGRLLTPHEIDALIRRTGNITLTDSFAPVDNMLRPIVRFTHDVACDALLNTAETLISEGRYRDAIEQAHRAIDLMPESARAHEILGYAQSLQGDTDDAVRNLAKAIELDPSAKQAISRLARTVFFQGDVARSIELLKKLERLDPDYPTLHQQFAAAYTATGQYDLAWTHVQKARELGENVHQGVLDQLIQASGRPQ